MEFFFDTVETIESSGGTGFKGFGPLHLAWLCAGVTFIIWSCRRFASLEEGGRRKMKYVYAALLLADEAFKHTCLLIGGRWIPDYIPLHLCSVSIFICAAYAVKKSDVLGNYLYAMGMPGAAAALLFPTWVSLPLANFMHIHSFTVHILLVAFPAMLLYSGEIKRDIKSFAKALILLFALAALNVFVNYKLGTNFMFLAFAPEGTPMYWMQEQFGGYYLGYAMLIALVVTLMYLPYGKMFRKK